jgi:lipopolysaccharide transport system ATP-binding protein
MNAPAATNDSKGYAIRVHNVSKKYRLFGSPLAVLQEAVLGRSTGTDIFAVKGISFDVRPGEVVGVIGRNGAGKSTLLKMIAGVLPPSTGRVELWGKVASILELGTGFNIEYTGRENIYWGGLCAGMSEAEVKERTEWIIDFSELRHVIDLPFKTYSSGMQARLTFSTAIAASADLYIIDEALAAGDTAFVEKCLGRLDEIVRGGAAILLTTHGTNLISRFGRRAIWIEEGAVRADGDAEAVAKAYELSNYQFALRNAPAAQEKDEIGDGRIRIVKVALHGETVSEGIFRQGRPLRAEIEIQSEILSNEANFYFAICRHDGQIMWSGTNALHLDRQFNPVSDQLVVQPGTSTVRLELGTLHLSPGQYYVNIGIEPYANVARVNDYHDYKVRIAHFGVMWDHHMVLNKLMDSPSHWSIIGHGSADRTAVGSVQTLDHPYPFRASMAISNDVEMLDWDAFVALNRMMTGPGGLGIPISNSFFFFTTNAIFKGTFGYFSATTSHESEYASRLRDLIRAGIVDTVHAYGDFDAGGFMRSYAELACDAMIRHGLRLPVFTNHGTDKNHQNVGHDALTNYQRGDDPEHPEYHLDFTRAMGARYYWLDDCLQAGLGAGPLLASARARDGTTLDLFNRFRGLAGRPAPNAGTLHEQITIADVENLIETGGATVVYQHFGVSRRSPDGSFIASRPPFFAPEGTELLKHIAVRGAQGDLWLATVPQLLEYQRAKSAVAAHIESNRLIVSFSNGTSYQPSELPPLSFKVREAAIERVLLRGSGGDVQIAARMERLPDGSVLVSLPRRQTQGFELDD